MNSELWHLWCYCLLKARHDPGWVTIKTGKGTTEIHLEPGQTIFGRNIWAEKLKQNPNSLYKRLVKLKNMKNITIQSNTHCSIVTVLNWASYQLGNIDSNTQSNTQVTPKYQPSNTKKNDKNDKNENNLELTNVRNVPSTPPIRTEKTGQEILQKAFALPGRKSQEIGKKDLFNHAKSFGLMLTYPEIGALWKGNTPDDAMFILRKFREYLDANGHIDATPQDKKKLWYTKQRMGHLNISFCRDYTPGRIEV